MKYIFYLSVFLLVTNAQLICAQKIEVKTSEEFDFLDAWSKVIQLTNGNTLLIQVPEKNGFNVILFDQNKKIVSNQNIKPTLSNSDLKKSEVVGMFEINGRVEFFISDLIDRYPTLFRLTIDANSGVLISEKEVAKMANDVPSVGAYFAYKSGGIERPRFTVTKDKYSDYYAIVEYTQFAETDERIRIKHLNSYHHIINESFYSLNDETYEFINFMDVYVKNSEYVLLSTYVYTKSKKNKDKVQSKIFVSKLTKYGSKFQHAEIPYAYVFNYSIGYFVENPLTKNIHLFIKAVSSVEYNRTYYSLFVTEIILDKFITGVQYPVMNSLGVSEFKRRYQTKNEYFGSPHYFGIDQLGYNKILWQETQITYDNGIGGCNVTALGNIIFNSFVNEQNENYGILIPCKYKVLEDHDELTYNIGQRCYKPALKSHGLSLPDYWYFHIDVVHSSQYSYLFINNSSYNYNLTGKKKPKQLSSKGQLQSYSYMISESGAVSTVDLNHLHNTENNTAHNFQSAHFNDNTNVYAVLAYEVKPVPNGYKYKSKLVWYQLL